MDIEAVAKVCKPTQCLEDKMSCNTTFPVHLKKKMHQIHAYMHQILQMLVLSALATIQYKDLCLTKPGFTICWSVETLSIRSIESAKQINPHLHA